MRTILSGIIFTKDTDAVCAEAKNICSEPFFEGAEETCFDITVYPDSKDVNDKLCAHNGFDAIITIGNIEDFPELFSLPFCIRTKWAHLSEFDASVVANSIIATFKKNLSRKNDDVPLFSIFTSAYRTSKEMALRLYESLQNQTYNNWNWWILDDSPDNYESYFRKIKDPRIHIIKNVTSHGNIGYNKHLAAMIADGDYLVEVDHDDELTPDCLETLLEAFSKFDCDFAYSYCFEEIDGIPVTYDDGFALGLGYSENMMVNGKEYYLPITPDVNVLSMRHIVAMPNHVRVWKRDFYHRILGHSIELSVMDDTELIIRTFLNGTMCKIPKVLYIQHEGNSKENVRGSTTQAKRGGEIWRTGRLIKERYDKEIHDFALAKGIPDPYWDDNIGASRILEGVKEGTVNLNYTL